MTDAGVHAVESQRRKAACPRCGYSLRGVIESWRDASPLTGTCAECGLVFDWPELLSTRVRKPRWNVEYGRSWLTFPIIAMATLAMSFAPSRFWSSLKMTHEFRPRRVATYLLLPLLVLYLIFAIGQGYSMHVAVNRFSMSPGTKTSISAPVAVGYAMLLPLTDRSPGTISYSYLAGGTTRFYITNLRYVGLDPNTGAVILAIESPRQLAARTYGYYSGYSFWEIWPDVLTGRSRGSIPWKLLIGCLGLLTAHCLLCPLGYILLPVSRRRARVRWSHIVRITMYSLSFVMFLMLIAAALYSMRRLRIIPRNTIFSDMRLLTLVAMPVFLVAWWSYATQRYLKIPHGWGVGLSLSVIAYLLGPVLLFCFFIFTTSWFA